MIVATVDNLALLQKNAIFCKEFFIFFVSQTGVLTKKLLNRLPLEEFLNYLLYNNIKEHFMIKLKTFSENGGFYVEFNGIFLGAGQAEMELRGQAHELRRDNLHLLRQRVLSNMSMKVKVRLTAGDRFWELLCANAEQAEKLC